MLSFDRLKNLVPDSVLAQLPDCAKQFGIDTPLRLAHFLAQVAHESKSFKAVEENLNYSAERLKEVFPRYFPGNLAEVYALSPEKIASRVYGDRMGNGDEASKDGYRYRGRGYIQLTGKDNYAAFDRTVDDDVLNQPDLVKTKYPLLSAAWFWDTKKLNALADEGSGEDVVAKVTKKVNGGLYGLEDRIRFFNQYLAALR